MTWLVVSLFAFNIKIRMHWIIFFNHRFHGLHRFQIVLRSVIIRRIFFKRKPHRGLHNGRNTNKLCFDPHRGSHKTLSNNIGLRPLIGTATLYYENDGTHNGRGSPCGCPFSQNKKGCPKTAFFNNMIGTTSYST